MAEVKEAPRAKAENGRGQTKENAPRTSITPMVGSGSPLALMRRFAREMDHLFDDFGLGSAWHMPRFLRRGRRLLGREADFGALEWAAANRHR